MAQISSEVPKSWADQPMKLITTPTFLTKKVRNTASHCFIAISASS
jgi:hypothetical protein